MAPIRSLKPLWDSQSVFGPVNHFSVKNRKVGVDCDYVARGRTEEELFKDTAAHGKSAHKMDQIPPEVVEKARSAIRYTARA